MHGAVLRVLLSLILSLSLTNCANSDFKFGLAPEADTFEQSSSLNRINTIDLLWVVDNSGSMDDLQTNMADNMGAFMSDFVTQGYDFQMAVTTTEAWQSEFPGEDPELSKFRDGFNTVHTGVRIVTPLTLNPVATFVANFMQGTDGTGDERAFSSFRAALDNPFNAGFVRPGGYLSIIIVSDEDDFSHDGTNMNEEYDQPGIHSVQSYVDYLSDLTKSTGQYKRFNVSTVSILDQNCLDQSGGRIGNRHAELADATGGVKVSVCSPTFAKDLTMLKTYLLEMLTQFYLSRKPAPETIVVHVNDKLVPAHEKNGWTYHSDNNSIRFHGTEIPAEGAKIGVNYDPLSAK